VALEQVSLSLGSFDALSATRFRLRFAPHVHEFFALGVIEAGANNIRYRGTSSIAGPGSVVAISPGQLHTGEPAAEDGWSYRMIYPTVQYLVHAFEDEKPADPIYFPTGVIDDPDLAAEMVSLHIRLLTPGCALAQEVTLLGWLRTLVDRHGRNAPGPSPTFSAGPAVTRVREFLDDNLERQVRLAELATVSQLSPFYLIRAFRRAFGMPPHAYLKQRRVGRAQEMLRSGRSISDAAYACGFSDQSHLGRTFKSVMGVSPGIYARACHGNR
jgi:AraC-like DNA-binding protein